MYYLNYDVKDDTQQIKIKSNLQKAAHFCISRQNTTFGLGSLYADFKLVHLVPAPLWYLNYINFLQCRRKCTFLCYLDKTFIIFDGNLAS